MSAFHFFSRPSRGDPAPSFSLRSMSGAEIALDDFRGRPVLLHYWATWCGVCRQEFPSLIAFAREMAPEGLVLLAISEDGAGGEGAIDEFFRFESPPFPILLDPEGAAADAYMSWGVQETVLVDSDGLIMWRRAGPVDWNGPEMRALVREVAATAKPRDLRGPGNE